MGVSMAACFFKLQSYFLQMQVNVDKNIKHLCYYTMLDFTLILPLGSIYAVPQCIKLFCPLVTSLFSALSSAMMLLAAQVVLLIFLI